MAKKPRKIYDKEFKLQALKLSVERGNQAEVARDLGIHQTTLSGWKHEFMDKAEKLYLAGGKTPEEIKIKELEKELTLVKMERDVLKKVVAIFSKPQK
ncbi:MAG: transposase [Candidatus Wallbacteria bacterium]|nr:transposase [Candidatus Wallbacteria bacterium]